MDDKKREIIVECSAYIFILCVIILFGLTSAYGKDSGFVFMITAFPVYSLYYAIMYRTICSNYDDPDKRIAAFGITGRGSLTGAIYHACNFILFISITLTVLIVFDL